MKRVRIAIIGLGQRGPAHMAIMSQIEAVEIRALCDIATTAWASGRWGRGGGGGGPGCKRGRGGSAAGSQ